MTKKYLIGLDIGGWGGQCMLVNADTGVVIGVYKDWKLPHGLQAGSFPFMLDTEHIWRTLRETTQGTFNRADVSPREVAGVSATSMRYGLEAIDKKGNVLLATPNRDSRAIEQGMWLVAECGEVLYRYLSQ
jgi:sugar (pentulose or hexulose) kinase